MIISAVEMENIRSYKSERIDFPRGIVLLSGDIGSGKTSVLAAIEFALFGTDEVSGDSLLRKGQTQSSVRVEFIVDEKMYAIFRRLKKTKNGINQLTGYIEHDGQREELTPTELRARIFSLLGYPQTTKKRNSIFRSSVYCPQENMKVILIDTPQNRLNTIRKMFGMDRYHSIASNAALVLRNLRQDMRLYSSQSSRVEELKEQFQKLQSQYDALNTGMEPLSIEIISTKEKADELNIKVENAENIIERFNVLSTQRTRMEASISTRNVHEKQLLGEINEIQANMKIVSLNYQECKRRYDILINKKAKINAVRKNSEEMVKQLNEQKRLSKGYSQRIKELEKVICAKEALMENQQKTDNRIQECREIVAHHKASITDDYKNIASLNDCPLCRQPLTPEHKEKVLLKENEKRKAAQKNIYKQTELMTSLIKAKGALSIQSKKVTDAQNNLHVIKAKLDMNHIEEIDKKIEYHASILKQKDEFDLNELKKIEEEMRTAKEQESIRNRLKTLKEQMESIQKTGSEEKVKLNAVIKEQKELKIIDLKPLKERKKVLTLEYHEAIVKLKTAETKMKGVNELLLRIKADYVKEQTARQKLKCSKKNHDWIDEFLLPLTQTVEKHLFAQIHHDFSRYLAYWFEMLIEDGAMKLIIDASFTPSVCSHGHTIDAAHLSGGERTAVSLAYRLALNKVINSLIDNVKTRDIIILDEPTEGFSSDQLDRMREVLDSLQLKQVILVSHDQKIESYAHHVIRITKKENISSAA